MALKTVKETAKKIKQLEIQGATNIATKAVEALTKDLYSIKEPEFEKSLDTLNEAISILESSRTTEPMMRNGLRYIKTKVLDSSWRKKPEFQKIVKEASNEILLIFNKAKEKIVEIGTRRIHDGNVILSHCHSSAVTATLLKAKEKGTEYKVIQTETRPKYQGRITAKELIEAGVDTTMIVDSATRHIMKKVDFVLVGSDAITSEGNVINKIGTSQVALAAMEARIPFYVVSSLLKFNPETIYGEFETIEERSPEEIWDNPPEGLKIWNPAFDVTRRDYVHGLFTEDGVISPHTVLEAVKRRYPWIL